jgi:hypothetical protein
MAARAAVSFVQQGCEMLREGQAIVKEFQGDAEGIVNQFVSTADTIKGFIPWATTLWDKLLGAFKIVGPRTPGLQATVQSAKPVAKKTKKREPEPDAAILQMQVVHDVSQQLGKFFDIQQQIITHYAELEETSLHVYEEGQNHAMKAIERVEVELQMEEMTVLIRETMVYAPKELKDLYTRFLQMYGRIKDEQEFARQEQLAARRYKEASKWQRRSFRIEMGMWAVGLVWVLLILWGMLLELESLTGSLG